MTEKTKRVPLNVSVAPEIKQRLEKETASRMLGPVVFVERALLEYFDRLDRDFSQPAE